MSGTIGIQLITPATGTPQGQSQQQANDNAAKAAADVLAAATSDAAKPQPPQALEQAIKATKLVDKTV